MTALREVFAHFGVQFDTGPLERGAAATTRATQRLSGLDGLVKRMRGSLSTLGLSLGAGAVAYGISRFVSGTIAIGDELENTAIRMGLSTKELQRWRHAAEMSNVSAEEFGVSVRQLQRAAFDAATGGSETSEAFRRIGVEVRGADGQLKSVDQLLLETGLGLNSTANLAERTALSMRVFGRSGNALLPMFAGGAEGVASLRGELDRLGGGASPEMVEQAAQLDDEMVRLRASLLSVRSAIAVRILPVVERAVEWFTKTAASLSRLRRESHLLPVVFGMIGTAAATEALATIGAWGPAALTLGIAALSIAALVLVADDLYTTFASDESETITRRFLEWAFGAAGAAEAIHNVQQAIEDLIVVAAGVAGFFGIETDFGQENRARQRATERGGNIREIMTSASPWQTAANQATRRETRRIEGETAALRWQNDRPVGTGARLMAPSPFAVAPMFATSAASGRTTNVDAPMNVQVTVNAATDAREVDRRVRRAIQEEGEAQRRAIIAAAEDGEVEG
jgi:hypothetical protein